MKTSAAAPGEILEIRKYSNRRFYNGTHSRHLTLEEIRDLIKAGHQIRVTDNQTSADITAKVLAQIILDLDAPKLDLFPAPFLAEIIRVNDHLLKGFYERFFHQALNTFRQYQALMESQLKHGGVLPAMFPPLTAWTHAMMAPFGAEHSPSSPDRSGHKPPAGTSDPVAATLADLQRQVTELKANLRPPRKSGPTKSRPKRST